MSKEENHKRNLTSNNFATHLSALRNFCKLAKFLQACKMAKRSACCRTESELCWRNFATHLSALRNFRKPFFTCETGENKFHKACETKTEDINFVTSQNSPYVNFRYFPADSIRFLFQDILCNYSFSPCNQLKIFLDIVISWRYFVFRYLGYFSEGL